MKISRRFFWFSLFLALTSLTLVWYDTLIEAIDQARNGEWLKLAGILCLFGLVFVAFGIIFKETKPRDSIRRK